jgi:hypothetical protein
VTAAEEHERFIYCASLPNPCARRFQGAQKRFTPDALSGSHVSSNPSRLMVFPKGV